MHNSGTLFIVSAPSGAGKTSLMRALTAEVEQFSISVSTTTRPMRPAEVEGQDYHFVSLNDFKDRIGKGEFLEYAEVFGNFYGTSILTVEQQLAAGNDLVLEIDWQGAQQIRERLPDTVSIFILPPSKQTLEQRLRNRGQDDDAVIAKRMAAAMSEISHYNEYDYLVVNDNFDTAKNELVCIVSAQRLTRKRQEQKYQQLIDDLL